jgi:predicted metalloprotease
MRLGGQRESDNVEDRRGIGVGGGAGIGCGGLLLVLGISVLTGKDPMQILQLLQGGGGGQAPTETQAPNQPPANDHLGHFATQVLGSTEDAWGAIFQESGQRYVPPKLVLFDGGVNSACGMTSSAVGPFYCPADRKVYLDLSFFDEMARRFGAPGDFAQAYVIAHEVGHHVQNLLGISDKISRAQESARSEGEANALSVRLELQADCLAGVWAARANRDSKLLEPGDIEEGLNAAAAIGDDRLQRRSAGVIQPESFTHGSSKQRVNALHTGLEGNGPGACRSI